MTAGRNRLRSVERFSGSSRRAMAPLLLVVVVGVVGLVFGATRGAAAVDDGGDDGSEVSALSQTVTETDGNQTIVVAFELDSPASATTRVRYITEPGTATRNDDYAHRSGTVTFQPGQTERTVNITVRGDTIHEPTEAFQITLYNPTGLQLGDDATITILDDDPPDPAVSVLSQTVTETDGNQTIVVVFELDGPAAATTRVRYVTEPGTATRNDDYAHRSGTVTFQPGQTERTVNITVRGDTIHEPTEAFQVTLNAPTGLQLGDDATITILDDDSPDPVVSVLSQTVTETDTNQTVAVSFELDGPATATTRVRYITEPGTATRNDDYSHRSGTITFQPGQTERTANITIRGDTISEPTAAFQVTLNTPTGLQLGDNATITIVDDDGADLVYVSTTAAGRVDAVDYRPEDILRYDSGTDTWSLFFDGSDVGLGSANIDAMTVIQAEPTAEILFSLTGVTTIAGLGTVDDSDVVRFLGTSGDSTVASTLELFFDGSDVGLEAGSEDVDAITAVGGDPAISTLAISTLGPSRVPRTGGGALVGADEDLLLFNADTTGQTTSGEFELFFDGSDVDLQQEDLTGAWYNPANDTIYATSLNGFNVPGLSGDGNDVFVVEGDTGPDPTGTFSLFFDGDGARLVGKTIDGLHIELRGAPTITSDGGAASANVSVVENTTVVTDVQSSDDNDAEGSGLTYSLTTAVGGVDNGFFFLNHSTGVLAFITGPDYEAPADDDGDNDYEVEVTVTDSDGLPDTQTIAVTITDVATALPTTPDPVHHDNGSMSSLALDSAGNPVVSHWTEVEPWNLRFLHCDDPNCDGIGDSASYADTTYHTGIDSSLVLDAAGNPVISYQQVTNLDEPAYILKLMHCDDPDCRTPNSIATPDTNGGLGGVGSDSSLALDSAGNPVISYFDQANGDLKVLHCDDPNCDGVGESISSPDTTGDVGSFTSLALDGAGNPVVSYYDRTNGDLKVLHCDDPNCDGVGESISSPDTTGDVGSFTSLVLDGAGNPVVSYYDRTNGDLKVLHCDDPNCDGVGESITSPDTTGNVGFSTSLDLDGAGNPVIAYTGRDIGVKVLRCDDPNCDGTGETAVVVDPIGSEPSMVLDSIGNPVLSYGGFFEPRRPSGFNATLKILHCNDPACIET